MMISYQNFDEVPINGSSNSVGTYSYNDDTASASAFDASEFEQIIDAASDYEMTVEGFSIHLDDKDEVEMEYVQLNSNGVDSMDVVVAEATIPGSTIETDIGTCPGLSDDYWEPFQIPEPGMEFYS
jgi:hypothetical protein